MSISPKTNFTQEQLLADLKTDGIYNTDIEISKIKGGSGKECSRIAFRYFYSDHRSKAKHWFQLAADKNFKLDYRYIATTYYNNQEYVDAIEWYLKLAEQFDKDACYMIAIMFSYGRGVPCDRGKALEWFTKSGKRSSSARYFESKGHCITRKEKKRSVKSLIAQTEDTLMQERRKENILKKGEEKRDFKKSAKMLYKKNVKVNIKPSVFRPRTSIHKIV